MSTLAKSEMMEVDRGEIDGKVIVFYSPVLPLDQPLTMVPTWKCIGWQRLQLSFPVELRLLGWRHYPLKSFPQNFSAKNLVLLDLSYSHVEKLWDGKQNLKNLKEVSVYGSKNLKELDLSKASNLEVLDIGACPRLTSVTPSIISSNTLKLNKYIHVPDQKELLLSNLKNLKEVSVYGSENLKELDLSKASNLEVLDIGACPRLTSVTPSILSPNKLKLNKYIHVSDEKELLLSSDVTGEIDE
ncbi:hypothetical protein Fmac_012132 [Flemingia macrophylla]|uniref:Disease resistance protein At4g27190-like leucine-rich repeats domain-containing protein n=1 Tax=Flemingia macrophylla TaxID=520843 RepID=A0ABD1MPF3_9FABA